MNDGSGGRSRELRHDVVLSIKVGHRKPHPVIYQAALERIGGDTTQALFVSDPWTRTTRGPGAPGFTPCTDADGLVPTKDRLTSVLELPDALDGHHIT